MGIFTNTTANKMVKKVGGLSEFNDVISNASGLVIVDFYTDWCGPCKRIAPDIENLEKEETSVTFLKVNVDESEDVTSKYEISSMPTFLFIKNGTVLDTVIGAALPKIKEKLNAHK